MSCSFRIMRGRELIFERLLGKPVEIKASGLKVQGRLIHVDVSSHNGFGNIILETSNGLAVIRGSSVQSVCEVKSENG